jgi:Flp pilus assembly protein protease CpaA
MWQAIASVALVVAVVDGALKRIPNALLIVLAGWAVFAVITQCVQVGLVLHTTGGRPWAGITTVVGEKAMGFALATIAFLMVRMVSKGGLGAGDVKLYALLGFGAGLSGIIALILISLILSAITGVVLMLFRKRTAKDVLPLAPFTFIAVVATVALGF